MPALGMAQETGKLIAWLAKVGDKVEKGQPLLEIETDKATVEIEATGSGILSDLYASEGEDIPVGQVIAFILAPGESAPEIPKISEVTTTPEDQILSPTAVMSPDSSKPVSTATTSTISVIVSPLASRVADEHNLDLSLVKFNGGRIEKSDVIAYLNLQNGGNTTDMLIAASPKARRLANERGLQMDTVSGSGPDGAVLVEDVIGIEIPARTESSSMSKAWRVMAERMTASWTSVPHFFLLRQVNASQLVAWRKLAIKQSGGGITYTDLLIKIVAAALEEHPQVNASWINNNIQPNSQINIGIAVATDDALLVPVMHQADKLNIEQIAAKRQEIVKNAQVGRLKLDEIVGGTFTISNLGMYNVDAFNAIINTPQAAILAVGRISDQVVPINGRPEVQPMINLSLSSDHRVVDGARAAQFLDLVASMIEEPADGFV